MALAPLAGCATPPGDETPPPVASACAPIDDEVAYDRVRPQPAELARVVALAEKDHTEVRRKAGLPAESPRGERIRIFTWGSFLPGRYSLVATRAAGGAWNVVKASEGREGGRLPAEAASIVQRSLEGDPAERLNGLVADRCLYAEPTYYGRTVPMREGGEATCADGADYLVEIEAGGRRHRSFHACHTFGRPGQVANIMWEATAGD